MIKDNNKLKVVHEDSLSEADLQRKVVQKLRIHGAIPILTDAVGPALHFISDKKKRLSFINFQKARGWDKGIPDLIVIWKDEVLFLELKFNSGKLSPEQLAWKNRLESNGYQYACWRTLEECNNWIVERLNK